MTVADDGTQATEDQDDALKSLTGNEWDRLDKEPSVAWAAFKRYRDMGLGRSVPKLSREMGKPRTTLATYSMKYSWVMRAAAWDAEEDRLDQQWMQAERRRAVKRHVRQAQSLQSIWIQRLQTLSAQDLTATEVLRYAEIATKLERDALRLSEPDTVVNVTVGQVDALSAEDTRLRLALLQKEIAARHEELAPEEDTDTVEAELIDDDEDEE